MFVSIDNLPKSATDGPETWGEAWARLAGAGDDTQALINNMNSDQALESEIYADRIARIESLTGTRLANPMEIAPQKYVPQFGLGRAPSSFQPPEIDPTVTIENFDHRVEALSAQFPQIRAITGEPVAEEAKRRRQQAQREEATAAASPELGTAGRITAQLAGGLMGAARDPFQWQMAAYGAGGATAKTVAGRIGQTMVSEMLLNGGQEAVLQAASQERKREAGLEYGLGDAMKTVGIAAIFGALFGGTIQGGSELARIWKLGEGGAERATRVLDGQPAPGDIEAIAAAGGVEIPPDLQAQISRSFEERALDDVMIPQDATPDDVTLMGAAFRHAEDPDNFPEPGIVERALADSADGSSRTLSADDYQRIYDGDETAVDALRDRTVVNDIGDTFDIDATAGQRIRPDEVAEPFDDAAMVKAETLAGDITEPRRVGRFGPIFRAEEFGGDWDAAVKALRDGDSGEVVGMLSHPELGPVDVVWGQYNPARKKQGRGLAKIAAKHPEVLQGLAERLPTMPIVRRDAEKVLLEDADQRAIVRLDYDDEAKTWLVTAYEKNRRAGKTSDRSGIHQGDGHSSSPSSAADIVTEIDAGGNLADIADMSRPRAGEPQTLFDLIGIEDGDGNIRLTSAAAALDEIEIDNLHADLMEACKL